MRNHDVFVRLHAAGATHRDISLILEDSRKNPDAWSGFFWAPDGKSVLPLLLRARIPTERADIISRGFSSRELASVPDALRSRGVGIVLSEDCEYPETLKALPRHPSVLYVRGKLPKETFAISVVGPRKASLYGKTVTERFVTAFVRSGVAIVSWGAAGIDTHAHASALEAGGVTVAFVGTGIDTDYPSANRELFSRIAASGAVVSAFAPWTPPLAHNFPIRNALVAAYSAGTLVTEAAENSGSLITAKLALEFSKEVFAIPGDVGRPGSVGTNSLIRDGLAKCVLRPEEVLSEFFRFSASESGIGVRTNPYGQPFSNPSARSNSPLFRKIEELGMPDAESLSSALGIPVEEVIAELSGFEIEGTVASDHFGRYSIR